jgi:hypothetical protein
MNHRAEKKLAGKPSFPSMEVAEGVESAEKRFFQAVEVAPEVELGGKPCFQSMEIDKEGGW